MPGRDLKGVHFAMDYLTQQNRHCEGDEMPWINAAGKHVIIIGGGDTGADCLGTVHRQGAAVGRAARVDADAAGSSAPPTIRGRCGRNIFRTSSAHEEGGDRVYAVETTEFAGDGRVARCAVTASSASSTTAAHRSSRSPAATFEMKADLVLLAMGFVGAGEEPAACAIST